MLYVHTSWQDFTLLFLCAYYDMKSSVLVKDKSVAGKYFPECGRIHISLHNTKNTICS